MADQKLAILFILSLFVAGCFQTLPAISDIRSDVVKVQTYVRPLGQLPSDTAIDAEAQRGCAEYGNVVSHRLSQRCINQNCTQQEYLYACKPR